MFLLIHGRLKAILAPILLVSGMTPVKSLDFSTFLRALHDQFTNLLALRERWSVVQFVPLLS